MKALDLVIGIGVAVCLLGELKIHQTTKRRIVPTEGPVITTNVYTYTQSVDCLTSINSNLVKLLEMARYLHDQARQQENARRAVTQPIYRVYPEYGGGLWTNIHGFMRSNYFFNGLP